MIDTLALIVGVALSLLFKFIPGFKTWYDALADEYKGLIMAAIVFLSAAVLYGLSCVGWLEGLWPGLGLTCDQAGLSGLIRAVVLALTANQATYLTVRKI